MRKVTISPNKDDKNEVPEADSWLDLEKVAVVEISSEDPAFPIEHALAHTDMNGWRAAATGPQRIRLLFDRPQEIRRIQLHFVENEAERSQEFWLLAFAEGELFEIVRQQWNFSPQGSPEELEDYKVEMKGVTALELRIDPDRSHDPSQSRHFASLRRLRLA
ncbi:MAG TPA: hypothetical protein VGB69_03220 [Edaphobacter sp.]